MANLVARLANSNFARLGAIFLVAYEARIDNDPHMHTPDVTTLKTPWHHSAMHAPYSWTFSSLYYSLLFSSIIW